MDFSELFLPLFCFVEKNLNNKFKDMEYDNFRRKINNFISNIDQQGDDFEKADLQQAKFAITAWIDEAIQKTDWVGKQQWQHSLLQEMHFNTSNAGEEFFIRIDSLTINQKQVLRVYYTCLALGFRGKLFHDSDISQLRQVEEECVQRLGLDKLTQQEYLFPNVYLPCDNKEQMSVVVAKWYQRKAIWWLAPLGALVCIYIIYYIIIYVSVDNTIAIFS